MKGQIQVRSAVICEDIRREVGGQATLVGTMVACPFPDHSQKIDRMGIYIEALVRDVEKVFLRVCDKQLEIVLIEAAFDGPDRKEFEKNNPDREYKDIQFALQLSLIERSIKVPNAGEYLLQVAADESQNWTTVKEIPFVPVEEFED